MKFKLFLEALSVKHGDVVEAMYKLMQNTKALKMDNATRAKMKDLMKTSDALWSSEIDEVTKAIEKSMEEYGEGDEITSAFYIEDIIDEAHNCSTTMGDKIVDYFSDTMNFEPGYKRGKLEFNYDDVESDEIRAALRSIPDFKKLEAAVDKADELRAKQRAEWAAEEKAERAKAVRKFSDSDMEEVAKIIRKDFKTGFSNSVVAKAKKQPEAFWDWFGFSYKDKDKAKNIKINSKEDLIKALSNSKSAKASGWNVAKLLIDWIYAGDLSMPNNVRVVFGSPKLLTKLVELVPELEGSK